MEKTLVYIESTRGFGFQFMWFDYMALAEKFCERINANMNMKARILTTENDLLQY